MHSRELAEGKGGREESIDVGGSWDTGACGQQVGSGRLSNDVFLQAVRYCHV